VARISARSPQPATTSAGSLRWQAVLPPFDEAVGIKWGELQANAQLRGRPRPVNDSWIAACCLAHDLPLAAFNTKDFADYAEHDGLRLVGTSYTAKRRLARAQQGPETGRAARSPGERAGRDPDPGKGENADPPAECRALLDGAEPAGESRWARVIDVRNVREVTEFHRVSPIPKDHQAAQRQPGALPCSRPATSGLGRCFGKP